MPRLVHISDLHFGRHTTAVSDALKRDIVKMRPDYTVISGDLTQRGRRREFAQAGDYAASLPGRKILVPGNHDIPAFTAIERFSRPYHRYQSFIDRDIEPVLIDDAAAFVGLNTARSIHRHWNWANGRLSRRQIEHVRTVMGRVSGDKLKVVVFHHPLVPSRGKRKFRTVTRNREAIDAFCDVGVDLVLTGHVHITSWADIKHWRTDLGRSMLAVQASTAISDRLRGEPNEYNIIDFEPGALTLTQRGWTGAGFEDMTVQPFRLADGTWHPEAGHEPERRRAGAVYRR